MAAVAVAVAALVLLAAGLLVLAVAPRLALFDDPRRRAVALAVFAVVALGGPALANGLVRREAHRREDAAADALYDALRALPYDDLRTGDPGAVLAGAGVAVSGWEVRADGAVAVQQPVRVAWVSWCVLGEKRPDGDVRVERTTAPCPRRRG